MGFRNEQTHPVHSGGRPYEKSGTWARMKDKRGRPSGNGGQKRHGGGGEKSGRGPKD